MGALMALSVMAVIFGFFLLAAGALPFYDTSLATKGAGALLLVGGIVGFIVSYVSLVQR